jgi:hypothetical protein
MNGSTHMNYLALNQNILNKSMVIGDGPQEGSVEKPINTFNGLQVYLNGTHKMPKHAKLNKGSLIGSMIHPNALDGMPDCTGELRYEFWDTNKEYLIVVRLKLDESSNGESEPAADILAMVKRDTMPDSITQTEENHDIISKDMILCHFDSLFEFYNSIEELDDWTFEDDLLYSFVKYHFELKNAVDFIDKELK